VVAILTGKEGCLRSQECLTIIFSDLYEIIQYPPLILPDHCDPASYPSRKPYMIDRPSTIDDVCEFVVEYINSDVVVRSLSTRMGYTISHGSLQGLVSNKHITIAGKFLLYENYTQFIRFIPYRSSQRV